MSRLPILSLGAITLLAAGLLACQPTGTSGRAPLQPGPPWVVKARIALQSAFATKAVAADVHHLTFKLLAASDLSALASTNVLPPFAGTVALSFPHQPDGTYRLNVEAFGSDAAASSLSQDGPLVSVNSLTATDGVITYSQGAALTFADPLYLKSGGTIPVTVTGTGANRIDVDLLRGGVSQQALPYAATSFPIRNLSPGAYVLRLTRYATPTGGAVVGTDDLGPVTVNGPDTGYSVSGAFSYP